MSTPAHRERGVTLLISLIMLTILTLFVSAMIRLSSTNVLIAGNMAIQHALRDAVQQAIETDLNSTAFFTDAANGTGCWDSTATSSALGTYNTVGTNSCFVNSGTNGYTIRLYKPVCLKWQPAAGYSALQTATGQGNTTLADTYWEVSATGTDTLTGATVTLTQGVKTTTSPGNCNNGSAS